MPVPSKSFIVRASTTKHLRALQAALRGFSQQLFTDEHAQTALRKLRAALDQSDRDIHERNKQQNVAYEYFLSKHVSAALCY